MKKFVIDASIAVKWYIPEHSSESTLLYLDLYKQNQALLIAPDLIIAEVGNVIWKKVTLQEITAEEARQISDLFANFCPIKLFSGNKLLPTAMELSLNLNLTIYDSLYLSLAVSEEAIMVTADKEIKKKADKSPFASQVLLI